MLMVNQFGGFNPSQYEEARTNLLQRSQEFENADWIEFNIAAVSAGSVSAPDGTATADTMASNAGNAAHAIYVNSTSGITANVDYALSVFLKAGTSQYAYVTQNASTNNNICAVFDLNGTTGVATQTQVGGSSGTITRTRQISVGNGWLRCEVTGRMAGTARFVVIGFAASATGNTINSDANVTFNAAGTETLQIWGAQLERGSFATSYIPTTSSTVTRAALIRPWAAL